MCILYIVNFSQTEFSRIFWLGLYRHRRFVLLPTEISACVLGRTTLQYFNKENKTLHRVKRVT